MRVREEAIDALLCWAYGGDDPEAHDSEHETMAAYIDALIDRPEILRRLADTFAPN